MGALSLAFAPSAERGPDGSLQVPGFFVTSHDPSMPIVPLEAVAGDMHSPTKDGIDPVPGDDLMAPNAVTASRLNRVVVDASANVGYSQAACDSSLAPSAIHYDVVLQVSPSGGYAMTLKLTLEYSSTFPAEGMVVWLKKRQQLLNDEIDAPELLLIETRFEDFVNGKWVKINTNVRYAAEAEAVVQAVITSASGQTAGRVKTECAVEDAKMGPVGEKGRVILSYYCEALYSYAEMAIDNDASMNSTLVPLALQLPWAPLDSPAASCAVRVSVRGPVGAAALDPKKNILAFRDLQQSLVAQDDEFEVNQAQVVLIPEPQEQDLNDDGKLTVWGFARDSLPPVPAMILVWMSVPNSSDGWELVGNPITTAHGLTATLLRPPEEDASLLKAALPSGQSGRLIRCQVKAGVQPERGPKSVRVHTDVTISDASGSTGMRIASSDGSFTTVRCQFNAIEERRLFTRLKAIPHLRTAKLLMSQDIWRQVFVIFDSAARAVFSITCSVGDLDDQTVQALLSALRADTPNAEVRAASELLSGLGKSDLLNEWRRLLENLRGIAPGGSTSFIVGADHARIACSNFALTDRAEGNLQGSEVSRTAYVNLDTDGGNNAGPCYEAIERLVTETEVVHGHVFGVGSWVDQDCASKVAKILMGATSLYLTFPQENAASTLDREDLSRWIKVLRMRPLALTVSAGAVEWDSRHGPRTENAADCLFATGDDSLQFDAPDISDATCTKAKLSGLQAGGVATLYLMSRLPFQDLAARLTVNLCSASTNALSVVGGVDGEDAFSPAVVTVEGESLTGIALGHHWLSLLAADSSSAMASRKPAAIASNTSTLCTRLRDRIEDDLSFAWELPTKSGSTAMVGRAKTDNRPPVPEAQQPKEPELMKKLEPRKKSVNYRTTDKGLSKGGGAVKGSSPKGAKGGKPCGAPPPPGSLSGGAKGKGGKSCGAPPAGKGPGKSCGPPGRGKGKRNVMAPLHAEEGSGLWGPADLLRSSRWMAVGVATVSMTRAVIALRLLASSRSNSSSKPATSIGVGGQEVWDDYACDSCKAFPIIGPRFKAGNLEGFDVCTTCRVAGRVGLSSNFGRIENMKHALRAALQAILDWLPLVLCGTSQKEGGRLQASLPLSSQLALMDTLDLRQALLTLLPDVPAQRTA